MPPIFECTGTRSCGSDFWLEPGPSIDCCLALILSRFSRLMLITLELFVFMLTNFVGDLGGCYFDGDAMKRGLRGESLVTFNAEAVTNELLSTAD